jgi:signal transduction histidine kinase
LRTLTWSCVLLVWLLLLAVLRAWRREREAASRERGFLESLTHELRTPLAGMRLLGETLRAGRGRPAEHGSLIAAESERLEGLLERSLAAARGLPAPRRTACDATQILRSAIAVAQPRAERRSVVVETRAPEGPVLVEWDEVLMQGAILNLVDNAIRHGKQDGHVQVTLEARDESVVVRVSDDGPGIAPRDRSRLFGRFARGSATTSGMGLGLHLVDGVSRSHGGRVELETRLGEGSSFTLVVPRRPAT